MNFMWDIALRAQKQGRKEEDLFFCQAEEYSPFYEQAFEDLNETKVESGVIELNLLLRFAGIFQYILSEDGEEYPAFRRYLADAALHMILYADLRHGLTIREVYVRRLQEELEDGTFWKEGAGEFRLVPREKRGRLATLVLTQMQTGSSMMLFRRGVLILYPDAMLYQIKADRKKLLLCLRERKTETNERMLRLVKDLFLPVCYELRVFWEYHFGIIGAEGTMRIDEIALY